MGNVRWSPIEPLREETVNVDFAEIDALKRQWLDVKSNVEASNPTAYEKFNEELYRSWAIETGIIEGLYELDRGITQTLIERGFVTNYIERNSSNRTPGDLIATLRDHRAAIDHIYGWIADSRPLTIWFIKSLHEAIARNQTTYAGVDQFGNAVTTELHRGRFKQWPNNPTRPDGVVHEYCPPEHVESELDRLKECYQSYDGKQHPLAIAAWLHHRFTQIHPFEDGNGRVVRALLTWHLVRGKFLPIVVTRDTRPEYIATLEAADSGELSPHVRLLVKLERQTLLDALKVEHGHVTSIDTVSEVVGFISDRFRKKQKEREAKLRSVQDIALEIRNYTNELLQEETFQTAQQLNESIGWNIFPEVSLGGPEEENEYYYRREVLETANSAGHWVNFQEPRYFVRVTMRVSSISRSPTMVFVVSLHSVGRYITGVMAATNFVMYRYPSTPDEGEGEGESLAPEFDICSIDPFFLTVGDQFEQLRLRFETWLRQGYSLALQRWGERVVEQA